MLTKINMNNKADKRFSEFSAMIVEKVRNKLRLSYTPIKTRLCSPCFVEFCVYDLMSQFQRFVVGGSLLDLLTLIITEP